MSYKFWETFGLYENEWSPLLIQNTPLLTSIHIHPPVKKVWPPPSSPLPTIYLYPPIQNVQLSSPTQNMPPKPPIKHIRLTRPTQNVPPRTSHLPIKMSDHTTHPPPLSRNHAVSESNWICSLEITRGKMIKEVFMKRK